MLKQTALIVDPPDGKIPPLTPQAQKAAEAHRAAGGHPVRMRTDGVGGDDPEDRGLSERCLVGFSTGPPFQPGGYNNNVQIVQTPGYVMLLLEMNHDARIIPMDGRPHLPGATSACGWATRVAAGRGIRWSSRPRTSRPSSRASARAAARPATSSAPASICASSNASPASMPGPCEYEFTVDDKTTFTRPFTARMPMNLIDQQIYEYACHEGNYGLTNILQGARSEEQRRAGEKPGVQGK